MKKRAKRAKRAKRVMTDLWLEGLKRANQASAEARTANAIKRGAKAMKLIRRLRAKNKTLLEVAERLNEAGYRTPRQKLFGTSAVARLIEQFDKAA